MKRCFAPGTARAMAAGLAVAAGLLAGPAAAQVGEDDQRYLSRCVTQQRQDVTDKLGQVDALLRSLDEMVAEVGRGGDLSLQERAQAAGWWRSGASGGVPDGVRQAAPDVAGLLDSAAATRQRAERERRLLDECVQAIEQRPPQPQHQPLPAGAVMPPPWREAAALSGFDCVRLFRDLRGQPQTRRVGLAKACMGLVAASRRGHGDDPSIMTLRHPGVCESALANRAALLPGVASPALSRLDDAMSALCP